MIRFIIVLGEIFYTIAVVLFARLVLYPIVLVYFLAEDIVGWAAKGIYRVAVAFPRTCWIEWRRGKIDPCPLWQGMAAKRGFFGAAWKVSAYTWETRGMVLKIKVRRKAGKGG